MAFGTFSALGCSGKIEIASSDLTRRQELVYNYTNSAQTLPYSAVLQSPEPYYSVPFLLSMLLH